MTSASECVPSYVRKRDGSTLQDFDLGKIIAAISAAWLASREDDPSKGAVDVARRAHAMLADADVADVELIQDAVETALMRAGRFDVAKAYILYRQQRAEVRSRRGSPDPAAIADYIHASKYARWSEALGRRELRDESVTRVEQMHLRKFAHLGAGVEKDIRWAFDLVRQKRVLPSMRSMQFGGAAVEANHARQYNCSFSLIDRPRAFAEAFYLLLCGCGVGYSVQFRHVDKLPPVALQTGEVVHHVVADDIEGWADAAHALVTHTLAGRWVEFAFHKIRDKGTPLKTSGGRAPGHLPLRHALERCREILLAAAGRRLYPIDCHRILCHLADAVLAGGIRRSAMIALFSVDDGEMMACKSRADWHKREPWLARANNSVALLRGTATEEQFRRIFDHTRNYGEPGFVFLSDLDQGVNPCAEIGLDPVRRYEDGTRRTGWAFCNLTTINCAAIRNREEFLEGARAASLIGTLQASYTNFPYLGSVSEDIARRDALIGVSMTGMQDCPGLALDWAFQTELAEEVVWMNSQVARWIGIQPAARCTCIKPEGTGTLTLFCEDSPTVASGIHPHFGRRVIRRVVAEEQEPPFQAFRAANPHMCIRKPDGAWVIEFPVEAREGAALVDDTSAVQFLEQVRKTQQNWVVPGTTRESEIPGLRHNVSCTVATRASEWDEVADHLWFHRDDFTAVSFLPYDVTAIYDYAPFEAVKNTEQERRWEALVASCKTVDYSLVREDQDATSLKGESACAGGQCEWGPRG